MGDMQVAAIAELLRYGIMKGFNSSDTAEYMKFVAQHLATPELFDKQLINELIHIHKMYQLSVANRDQLMFFMRFIAQLIARRDDWDFGEEVRAFSMLVFAESPTLRIFAYVLASHIKVNDTDSA